MTTRALLVLVAAAALCLPSAANAASTYNDAITGFEYYATSTEGHFAGSASGALPGYSTITGGSFSLATGYTLVTGTFTGGTVQVTNVGAGCTNQTFDVEGTLSDVGPWYLGSGTGTFSAILTHYRKSVWGYCVTYAASVSGSFSLTF